MRKKNLFTDESADTGASDIHLEADRLASLEKVSCSGQSNLLRVDLETGSIRIFPGAARGF